MYDYDQKPALLIGKHKLAAETGLHLPKNQKVFRHYNYQTQATSYFYRTNEQLVKEVKALQEEITWQELITQNPLLEELRKEKTVLFQTQLDQTNYDEQLRIMNNERIRLNRQLNWLRTLVRAGDINQLQELVRQARI